jgi:hypothetical protein
MVIDVSRERANMECYAVVVGLLGQPAVDQLGTAAGPHDHTQRVVAMSPDLQWGQKGNPKFCVGTLPGRKIATQYISDLILEE